MITKNIMPIIRIGSAAALFYLWSLTPAVAGEAFSSSPVFAIQPLEDGDVYDSREPATEIETLLERIEALEKSEAERASKEAEPPPKPSPAEPAKPAKATDAVPEDKWSVKFGGHVQMDNVL